MTVNAGKTENTIVELVHSRHSHLHSLCCLCVNQKSPHSIESFAFHTHLHKHAYSLAHLCYRTSFSASRLFVSFTGTNTIARAHAYTFDADDDTAYKHTQHGINPISVSNRIILEHECLCVRFTANGKCGGSVSNNVDTVICCCFCCSSLKLDTHTYTQCVLLVCTTIIQKHHIQSNLLRLFHFLGW